MFSLLRNFGKSKIQQTGDSLIVMLANFDPQTMSEAGMAVMEEELDKFAKETAVANAEYIKEQKEADEIEKLHQRRLLAAEHLSAQLDTAGEGDVAAIETSLGKLLDQIEKMLPDIEREQREAADAKLMYEELKATTVDLAEQMKNARTMFKDAHNEIKRANAAKKRAEINEDRAKRVAGIRNGGDRLSAAMNAMSRAAADANADASAAQMKADLLKPTSLETDDPLIVQAMANADGTSTPINVRDRLAALKSKGK